MMAVVLIGFWMCLMIWVAGSGVFHRLSVVVFPMVAVLFVVVVWGVGGLGGGEDQPPAESLQGRAPFSR